MNTNIQGVLAVATCSYCNEQTSTHYCRVNQNGTGCYIDGKEVCGHIMCTLCVLGWDGEAELFRGKCKECASAQKAKEQKTASSVTAQRNVKSTKQANETNTKNVGKVTASTSKKTASGKGNRVKPSSGKKTTVTKRKMVQNLIPS